MKILVVDDEFVSLQKLMLLLSAYGQCDAATNGAQALEMFHRAHEQNGPYDLITLDFDMPGMDGPSVAEQIRESELALGITSLEKQARILMVTAMTDGKSIMASFRKGCEGFLNKPFNEQTLRTAFETIGLV